MRTSRENAGHEETTDADKDMFYGWDSEMRRAWRCKVPDTLNKEFANEELEVGNDDMGAPMAVWHDGDKHAVVELTNLVVKAWASGAATRRTVACHFEDKTTTSAPVLVRDRPDRGEEPLVSILVSGRQVCQQVVNERGDQETAVDIMCQLAKALCAGTLEQSQLYKERDHLLKVKGCKKAITTRKQPASVIEPKQKESDEDLQASVRDEDMDSSSDEFAHADHTEKEMV